MKKLLLLTIAAIALGSCGESQYSKADQLTISNAVKVEDNSVYSVFVQKVDSVEYIVVFSKSNGSVAIAKK